MRPTTTKRLCYCIEQLNGFVCTPGQQEKLVVGGSYHRVAFNFMLLLRSFQWLHTYRIYIPLHISCDLMRLFQAGGATNVYRVAIVVALSTLFRTWTEQFA